MNDSDPRKDSGVPQLRTLLLTDLCDSTALVERLGDGAAADLFREHDRLVLELQQRWRGRLIDRSDGLLLLFERPNDGLGFALDYVRGLRSIGDNRKLVLQARSGLHVGEVLSWRNSDEAVQLGAKPLEVEGLAKPMAGRLMTLARAGQILMSSTAEPLMHRSARELGERGEHLLWKSWGRWRFKGVPNGQEVFEVGEPGFAPLRAPKNTAKAWRDIPLWRRPAALAAEVLLVVGIGTGAWFVTRPQPAIAFSERDWVVVGDLRNLTGQAVLDESLEQAFRISLEQSRYVNVLSDMKARDTLARMQRKPDTTLDRAVASEIAIRDGVRAVILPTVSEVGGRLRVSVEVIDPYTQTTVYAESADGSGIGSVLGSIDDVTGALRGKLGEALQSIEKDSTPLPQVSTSNLDALRSYALGVQAQAYGKIAEAREFYERAVQLDTQFSLAHLGLARIYAGTDNSAKAREHIRTALTLRAHLPARDVLYADAWNATYGPVEPMLEKWRLLWRLYPDYFAGPANYSLFTALQQNEYRNALDAATAATSEKNPLRGWAYFNRGSFLAALGRYAEAERDFKFANSLGVTGTGQVQANVMAAQRKFALAEDVLAKARRFGTATGDLDRLQPTITLPLDQGKWNEALLAAANAAQAAQAVGPQFGRAYRVMELSLLGLSQPNAALRADLMLLLEETRRALADSGNPEPQDAAFVALSVGYIGAKAGFVDVALESVRVVQEAQVKGYPLVDNLARIVQAELARLTGKPDEAIRLLDHGIKGRELYQTHVSLMAAYTDAKRYEDVLREARWLAGHRGLAYIELGSRYALVPLNVAESNLAHLHAALALSRLGRIAQAEREIDQFDRNWPSSMLPKRLRDLRASYRSPEPASSL